MYDHHDIPTDGKRPLESHRSLFVCRGLCKCLLIRSIFQHALYLLIYCSHVSSTVVPFTCAHRPSRGRRRSFVRLVRYEWSALVHSSAAIFLGTRECVMTGSCAFYFSSCTSFVPRRRWISTFPLHATASGFDSGKYNYKYYIIIYFGNIAFSFTIW